MIVLFSRPVALGSVVRHQTRLLARDPGPLIGYTAMPLLLITVLRPLYADLGRGAPGYRGSGIDQAAAGMAVMFSLFALKVAGANLLSERTWNTWDRLRSGPTGPGAVLVGKALPLYVALLGQQVVLFGFAAAAFGLRPERWWLLAVCAAVWSACVLLLGTAASTLARTPAQLSAAGDLLAIVTTVLAGALVPTSLLPGWLRAVAPVSPGYWAVRGYRAALVGQGGTLGTSMLAMLAFGVAGLAIGSVCARRRA